MTIVRRNTEYPIRPATPEDYEQIVEVWAAAGLSVRLHGRENREAFLYQLERFPDLFLVATDDDRIVGAILGSHDHRKGWINRLAVLPEYRRRGLGLALAEACDDAIRSQGIEIVAALIEPENKASCDMVEKLGYRADIEVRYYRKLSRPDI